MKFLDTHTQIAFALLQSFCIINNVIAGKQFRKGRSKVQEPVHFKEDARVLEFRFESEFYRSISHLRLGLP